MNITDQIQDVVRKLESPDQYLVLEVAKRLIPDYIATDDDLDQIVAARQEFAAGQTVGMNSIDWD
jgi:hypothetical protein